MSAATPGPWTVELLHAGQIKVAGPFMARGGRSRRIATVGSPRSYQHPELDAEIEANAALIAAAPDLLDAGAKALHELVATIRCVTDESTRSEMQAVADELRAAIVRATASVGGAG